MADAMLENRATVCAGNKEILCPRCDEPFVFGMKDNFHEFSIGLTTILECTAIAEHLGYLPQFPQEWWEATLERYPFLAYVRNNLNQRE
ncbi:hypothetical protein [Bilophila wadsworthia]|jgi:hypothetical protein|uniref:hypothetical protein n=1 Tax=Bilophila wadsworthia TaxID=35833 RepID=UPI00068C5EA6|nr:hypothetical protein [Bilophila wadsworthia]MCI6538599.1 hypothetical protein [Bilophila wadsworthia]